MIYVPVSDGDPETFFTNAILRLSLGEGRGAAFSLVLSLCSLYDMCAVKGVRGRGTCPLCSYAMICIIISTYGCLF